jgi:hypothetical protein
MGDTVNRPSLARPANEEASVEQHADVLLVDTTSERDIWNKLDQATRALERCIEVFETTGLSQERISDRRVRKANNRRPLRGNGTVGQLDSRHSVPQRVRLTAPANGMGGICAQCDSQPLRNIDGEDAVVRARI